MRSDCKKRLRIEKDEFPDFLSENELHAIETKMASFVETFLSVVPETHFAEIKEGLEKSGPLHCEYVCRNNLENIVEREVGKKEGDGFVSSERLDAADEIRREM